MDVFDVLLRTDKNTHIWCGPGDTISFNLLSALVALASKWCCLDLEDRLDRELSCCLNCVRVFHLTLSCSDADSLGLDEEDFVVLLQYLEKSAVRRVSALLAAGLGPGKKLSPAQSNAFLEVLNYPSLLRNSALVTVVEKFVVGLLDANVSIPKKTKCAGVFILVASSVERVQKWAMQFVAQCESQGNLITAEEVDEVLDRALEVLLDAMQGLRVVDGRHAVLGSSQDGLVVFDSARFYSALWFLLDHVSVEMKKQYATTNTARFAMLLRAVFSRVDSKTVCGEEPLKALCSLLKVCGSNSAVISPIQLWELLDSLSYGGFGWGDRDRAYSDALDMLMDKGSFRMRSKTFYLFLHKFRFFFVKQLAARMRLCPCLA